MPAIPGKDVSVMLSVEMFPAAMWKALVDEGLCANKKGFVAIVNPDYLENLVEDSGVLKDLTTVLKKILPW